MSTIVGFFKYCQDEGLLDRNPAANVRRPKVDHESRTLGLDRNELGGLLVQAGLGTAREHALFSLLALNGLRISEALNADIEALDMDRGHRTLKIVHREVNMGSFRSHHEPAEASISTSASGQPVRSSLGPKVDGWIVTLRIEWSNGYRNEPV